jgi:hypothetical protein
MIGFDGAQMRGDIASEAVTSPTMVRDEAAESERGEAD